MSKDQVKAEGIMDDTYCPDPKALLQEIVASEQAEIPLYKEIACMVPSACLQEKIMYFVEKESRHAPVYNRVVSLLGYNYTHYGKTPAYYAGGTLTDRIMNVVNIELGQVCRLNRLAMNARNALAREIIMHMAQEELMEAIFCNDILCAYSDIGNPCPAPCHPVGPGIGMGPGAGLGPGPGVGPGAGPCPGFCPGTGMGPNMPGFFSESEEEGKEKK